MLLTRGVHGLYLYAVDPALQTELLKAQGQRSWVNAPLVAEDDERYD